MGTGGVGGYFGAKLALAGNAVHFIARGAHLAAIKQNGLKVTSPLGDFHVANASVTSAPSEVGPVDVVLVGVKLWDTASAAEAIKPLIGADTMVISLQNGVSKDETISEAVGAAAVVGGVSYISSGIDAPGVIGHYNTIQRIVFGEYSGEKTARVTSFHEACIRSGFEAEISTDIRRSIWEKFVFLVGLSASTASTRSSIGVVRTNSNSRRLLESVMQEAVAVGIADGVHLSPTFAQNTLAYCDGLPFEMTASMYRDLVSGNRIEVPWLSGEVARRGARLGVPTPYNQAVADILSVHAEGKQ